MAKIALLTDTHFGCHSDSKEHLQYQQRFFDDIFFPTLEKEGISTIIDLGDTFDKRKNISFYTLKNSKKFYFDVLVKRKYECYVVVGNHTLHFRESNEINSPELLLSSNKNFHIISEPKELSFGGVNFLVLPWINKENQEACYAAIKSTAAEFLIGHFELMGVKLHNSWEFSKGIDKELLSKFTSIWSGHYHLMLERDNFLYLGTPYQIDWSDVDHKKGFYIFDTDSKNLEFIENPLTIFERIMYDDSFDNEAFPFELYKEKYIKVVLGEQLKDYMKFDIFKEKLSECAYKVDIEERFLQKLEDADEIEMKYEDTLSIMRKFIMDMDNIDNNGLMEVLEDIYYQAREEMD